MADERDLELLDDYITNRMADPERRAFEQKLQADPDLQHEYALQERVIKGIRDARAAQLKSMLNQVPVPAAGPGNALLTKVILGTVATFIIAVAAYWYVSRDDIRMSDTPAPAQHKAADERIIPAETEAIPESVPSEKEEVRPEQGRAEQDKNQTSAGTEHSKPSLAKKPDPLQPPAAANRASETPEASAMTVETDRNNAQYQFHYQLKDGKLFLYGPFDPTNYEVTPVVIDGKRSVFLLHKDRYYKIHADGSTVQPLTPVTDQDLLTKLKESREH